jgi:Tfp pilus assembly protein PilN
MKARLNLATNPLETHRKFLALSSVIGILAGIVFLALGWHVYSVRKANEALRAKADQVRQELAVLQKQRGELEEFFRRPENARLHERSLFLNQLIDEQSLNWTQMFMDLEKILPPGVRLLDIEPKHDKDFVKVKFHIGATSEEAKQRFLRALESSPAFSGVQDNSEMPVEPGANNGPDRLRVELSVIYVRG